MEASNACCRDNLTNRPQTGALLQYCSKPACSILDTLRSFVIKDTQHKQTIRLQTAAYVPDKAVHTAVHTAVQQYRTLTSTLHPTVGGGRTAATPLPVRPWQRECTRVVLPAAIGPTTRTLAWLGSKFLTGDSYMVCVLFRQSCEIW